MTDGVYGIGYGNTSGVGGGYMPPKKSDVDKKEDEQPSTTQNAERKDVNPDDVMRFLANNNYFINLTNTNGTAGASGVDGAEDIDAETEARFAEYMERFEEIYALIEEEFGSDLAPAVMDLVMDKLMGMA